MTGKKATKRQAPGRVDPSFVPVVAAFANNRRVSWGKMFSSSSVLHVDGKIFAMLVRGRIVAKLPKNRVEDLVSSGKGERFDPGHGRLMKEWVAVGTGRVNWVGLAKEADEFVKRGNFVSALSKTREDRPKMSEFASDSFHSAGPLDSQGLDE